MYTGGATPLPPLPFFVRRTAEGITGRTTSKVSPFLKRAIGRPYCGLRFVDAVVVSHCLLFSPLVVECFRTMLSYNAFVQGHLLSLSTGCETVDYDCQSSVGDFGIELSDIAFRLSYGFCVCMCTVRVWPLQGKGRDFNRDLRLRIGLWLFGKRGRDRYFNSALSLSEDGEDTRWRMTVISSPRENLFGSLVIYLLSD